MNDVLRVLVAVADPVMAAGVGAALTRDGAALVGAVVSGPDAVRTAHSSRPDVCLLDCDLEGALATAAALRRASPDTAVLLFGRCESLSALTSALAAGACGYLSKDVRHERLSGVLEAAAAGEPVVARQLVADLVSAIAVASAPPVPQQRAPLLTRREQEVLALVAGGHSTAAIARRLYVAPVTVRTHIAAIMRKLRVRDREDLARLVAE